MNKAKILVGLTVMVGLMAISVTTASAWFEQTNAPSGTGNIGASTLKGGNAELACEKAPFIDEVVEVSKQAHTKISTHLLIKHIEWKECKANGLLPAEVKGFEFQVKQYTKGQTTGWLVNVVTGGTITVPAIGCVVTISNSAANQQLKEISGENTGTNEIKGKALVGGITTTVNKACEEQGIKGTTEGIFTAANLKLAGQTLV